MGENIKLCMFCCRLYSSDDGTQNVETIRQFCTDISNNILKVSEEDEFNSCEAILKLDKDFGMSACVLCLTNIRQFLTSKQQTELLENRVLALQKEILEGLKDLDKCLNEIKCHQEMIKRRVKESNELNLKRLPKTANCFVLKLRQCIINDPSYEGTLKGSLFIPETEDALSKPQIKIEKDTSGYSKDDFIYDTSWNVSDSDDICDIPGIGIEKAEISLKSTMTLRTRRSKKTSENTQNPKLLSIRPQLIPIKKKTIKTTLKLIPENMKRTHIKPRRCCDLCPFYTKEEPSFEQHIREHEATSSEPKSLNCPKCPSKFSTNQLFQFHQKCHQGLYKMACDICNRQTPLLLLADHLKSHFPPDNHADDHPPPKIIYCKNCSYCCSTRKAYLLHLRRHNAKKIKGKFTCDICSEECSSPLSLLKHYNEKHEGTLGKRTCDFENCNRTFPARHYLIAHIREHKPVDKVPCPECHKIFKSKAFMESHYRIHSGEMPYPCNLCDQRFRWQSGLISHKRNDHGTSKLKCKVCEKEFCDNYSLKSHMTSVHENKGLSCLTCGKICGNVHVLKRHLVKHQKEKGFTCEQCGKGFKDEKALKLHLKVHSGIKNYKCEYCNKAFVRRENLKDHLRVHTGERPFVCEICGKDFNQASALKTHKKNQHPS